MLPFRKAKADDVVELDADDLLLDDDDGDEIVVDVDDVVMEDDAPPSGSRRTAPASPQASLAASPWSRTRAPRAPISYRTVDDAVEQDVMGECLKTFAAHVEASGLNKPAPTEAPPPTVWKLPPPVAPPLRGSASLPPLAAPPPFARTAPSEPATPAAPRASVPLFARSADQSAEIGSSIPPVSLGNTPSPTLVVLRERPKLFWMIAAAALGALCAAIAPRIFSPSPAAPPAAAAAPAETSVTTIATAVVAPPPPPAPPATLQFGDNDGVAIPAIATGPAGAAAPVGAPGAPVSPSGVSGVPKAAGASTSPRPSPAAPRARLGPALPDGSFGLSGRSEPARAPSQTEKSPAQSTPTSFPAAPPPGGSSKKKPLTPEQQLAEAQLKAS